MNDSSGSTRFKSIFDAALLDYEKQTGTTLADHPLAKQLETCESVESITAFFQEQVSSFRDFRDGGKIMNSLKSAIPVLHSLSTNSILRNCISVSFPPATAIFAGLAVLLTAIKGVNASFDALINLLECIGKFLNRLDIYVKIPPTPAITEVVVEIIVELISALALETKKVKQGRLKKFFMKLRGDNKVENALQRLDRLIQEESRTSGAQALAVIYSVDRKIDVLIDDGKRSAGSAQEAPEQHASEMNKAKRERLQQNFQNWLSAPDPWKNHNIAYKSHHSGTATWFLEGNTYLEWKSSSPSSPLWIYGKPGSGKTVLCSAIIEDINGMRKSGQASLAFFYCDFRDNKKRDRHELLSSFLVQLCDQSDAYHDILSDFYGPYCGFAYPTDDALLKCFASILQVSGQAPAFVVIDALDEVPNKTGMTSPRDEVLDLVTQLVNLQIPNLHICVTSRPETDIQHVLDPLSFRSISLHGESGQIQDIAKYIESVVNTNPMMRRWKAADKDLVIEVLNKKADGMFRWVFCQLVYLRRCIPARIRHALDELPETLDETYARVLQDIDEQNWEYARHLFECLSVSFRPLRVEELAEFLALDFDSGPIPILQEDWRPEDPGNDVLSMCSSLLSIVKMGNSHVIEFSHFTVKEYLTSDRLAKAGDNTSRYHVSMTPAHTTATQACLGVLLHLDKTISRYKLMTLPLVEYAARYLVEHAQFEGVWPKTQDGMKRLFEPDGPHLAIWVWIYHPCVPVLHRPQPSSRPSQPPATPLHYAAFYGLYEVAKFLVIERRQDVNALGFSERSAPLHYLCRASCPKVARLLLEHGADVMSRDRGKRTPLHQAWNMEVVQLLLDHGAEMTARDSYGETPLHRVRSMDVVRLLLERGADPMAQDWQKRTPLHNARSVEVARLLLQHGADATARDLYGRTPLHKVESVELARLLLEYGADATALDSSQRTPLHGAGSVEVAQLLLEHGADASAKDSGNRTPLHQADSVELTRLLLQYGGDATAQDNYNQTPLHTGGSVERVRLLLDHGADATVRDGSQRTPLHVAGSAEVAQLLLSHGADARAQNNNGQAPLHNVSSARHARLLLDHGADVTARDRSQRTPLHVAESVEVIRLLLDYGADATARDDSQRTPLHKARNVEVARLLLQHGADVGAQDDYERTPLHDASSIEVARFLLEHSADPTVQDKRKRTALHEAESAELAQLLLEHGADPTAEDMNMRTPLHEEGSVERARVLLDYGADVIADDQRMRTPLHEARSVEVAQLLLDHGADEIALDLNYETPLHSASKRGDLEVCQLLLGLSANANAQDDTYQMLLEEAAANKTRRDNRFPVQWGG